MDFAKFKELADRQYLTCFNRIPICFVRGEGCRLFDSNGREYIDFVAGIAVNVLGHNHPSLVSAISAQASQLIHISNLYYNQPQATLADKLLDGTGFARTFFCNSGAEANEAAIKLVRRHSGRTDSARNIILTALGSFHGRTLATVTAGGQPRYSQPFAPLPEGFRHVPYADLTALRDAMTPDVSALMLEVIQGESGVQAASHEYLIGAYALCREMGVLLVLDEVQTGMGRTGKFFAYEHFGIQPDIVTLAKGLGGGVPIGAVLARGEVAQAFEPGDHGTTFGGNPLACAAAVAVLDIVKNPKMLAQITELGEYLGDKLATLRKYKFVQDVRGRGLLWGIQLTDKVRNSEIAGKLATRGILVNACGANTLRLCPPYIITTQDIDAMFDALSALFAAINV